MLLILLIASIIQFTSPVHTPIELAGNFGEPRPNHFHGGIDVKTERCEGLGIYSIGDGYVTKILIDRKSYGRAIYVRHPEGYTSVYCHLRSFCPKLRRIIEEHIGAPLSKGKQPLTNEDCEIDLAPGKVMVSQGQFIGRSGNSGASQAPHLHLEIHDTKTFDMLDPQEFLGESIKDSQPPLAHSFMAYPLQGEGLFCGSANKQSYGFTSHNLQREFHAWGKVGFAVWANDFSEVTYNRLGVRHTWLLCDGDTVCHTDVCDVPMQQNRQINAWGDYEHFLRTRIWYLKTFRPQGVTLPFIETPSTKYPDGIVNFNQERIYHFKYVLCDIHGNACEYTFNVKGQKTTIKAVKPVNQRRMIKAGTMFHWNSRNAQLTISQQNSVNNTAIQPKVTPSSSPLALSDTYIFASRSVPLFRKADLSIRLKRKPQAGKQIVMKCDIGLIKETPCTIKDGWATAPIRELGAHYFVCEENIK